MADATTNKLARACARGLVLRPDALVAVALEDAALSEAMASLLTSSGATVLGEEGRAASGIVELVEPLDAVIPDAAMDAIERVDPGGRVVIVLRGGTGERSLEAFAEYFRPCFDLAKAHSEAVEDVVLLAGHRREAPSRSHVKTLRGLGHQIEPSVLVGRSGLTPSVVEAAREAAARHGLIKVKLTPQSSLDKGQAARAIAWSAGCQLVQRVGKTALLYRPDVPLAPPVSKNPRKAGRG
jgi:RNA-binding protein